MKVRIVFLCDTGELEQYIRQQKLAIIPQGSRNAGLFGEKGAHFEIYSMRLTSRNVTELLDSISGFSEKDDAIILLVEEPLRRILPELSLSAFVGFFMVPQLFERGRWKNLLGASIAQVLRNFHHFVRRFENRRYQEILRLPLLNFDATESEELIRLFDCRAADAEFGYVLNELLDALRERRRPKTRRGSSPEKYLVDDKARHFQLGHEQHGSPSTASPPHRISCAIAASFRFGARYEPTTHYNVSLGDDALIGGDFVGCHAEQVTVAATTHINMFTNHQIR